MDRNNGANSLHGGHNGFDRVIIKSRWNKIYYKISFKRNWKSVLENDCVKFSLSSPDGESGYPGG